MNEQVRTNISIEARLFVLCSNPTVVLYSIHLGKK